MSTYVECSGYPVHAYVDVRALHTLAAGVRGINLPVPLGVPKE
jgi:hypothetical protein